MLLLALSLNVLLPALPRIRVPCVWHGPGACIGMDDQKLANFDHHHSAVPLDEAVSQVGLGINLAACLVRDLALHHLGIICLIQCAVRTGMTYFNVVCLSRGNTLAKICFDEPKNR